jgi:hypothetical protein
LEFASYSFFIKITLITVYETNLQRKNKVQTVDLLDNFKMPQPNGDQESNEEEGNSTIFTNLQQDLQNNQNLLEIPMDNAEIISKPKYFTFKTLCSFCILFNFFFILQCVFLVISIVFFLIIADPLVYKKKFQNYEVYFNIYYSTPVRSTITLWQAFKNNEDCTTWTDDSHAWIKIKDYQKLPNNFVNGMLTPYMNIGMQSCNILNVIPQYKCHHLGVWRNFEYFVNNEHYGKIISTFPVYGNNFTLIDDKKIYIPEKLCKNIEGIDYCIPHDENICNRFWCNLITPSLPNCY